MRYLLLLVSVWLLTQAVSAAPLPADTAVLRVNRLPPDGRLQLTKGWRYHAGDNPAWAQPGFDASAWDTLNPARPRRELPPRLLDGIGWLRLRVRAGDGLRQRAVLLLARSVVGAYEVYFNGRRVLRSGVLRADPGRPVRVVASGLTPLR